MSATCQLPTETVLLGKIVGAHGIKGWVKVQSFTQPYDNLLNYPNLLIRHRNQTGALSVTASQHQGRGLIFKLDNVDDRNAAEALKGAEILIDKVELPDLADEDYYWHDLAGCEVFNQTGECLGVVSHILETGANDVLVVKLNANEQLIPFLLDSVIVSVDVKAKRIDVDWDSDF